MSEDTNTHCFLRLMSSKLNETSCVSTVHQTKTFGVFLISETRKTEIVRDHILPRRWISPACYLGGAPLPRPRPGPGPGPPPLGPGGRLTGLCMLGLGDARVTSCCRWTPLPGFVLVGLASGSGGFSVETQNNMLTSLDSFQIHRHFMSPVD